MVDFQYRLTYGVTFDGRPEYIIERRIIPIRRHPLSLFDLFLSEPETHWISFAFLYDEQEALQTLEHLERSE